MESTVQFSKESHFNALGIDLSLLEGSFTSLINFLRKNGMAFLLRERLDFFGNTARVLGLFVVVFILSSILFL